MAIGSFMGIAFTASDKQVLTPSSFSGSESPTWSTHDVIFDKPRSEYVAPGLRTYSMTINLRLQDGVDPRTTLAKLRAAEQSGKADMLVIGNRVVSPYPFYISDLSDEWTTVLPNGVLAECQVSMKLTEYR